MWCAGKAGQHSHGELLFSVLLEFWLTDGEEPSLKDPKDSRLAPPLPYEAPTPQLLEAMQVLCAPANSALPVPLQDCVSCATQDPRVT